MTVVLHAASSVLDGTLALQGWMLSGAVLAMAARGRDASRDMMSACAGARSRRGSPLFTGILIGIGIVGFLDEAIFHQLLQWHNFYWNTDQHGRILSDGLFHVLSTLLLIWGTLRLWFGTIPTPGLFLAGILIGAGGFNAYDGIVQHLLLHLHLVNEKVCPTPERGTNSILTCRADVPYEIAWIAIGTLVLIVGLYLWRRSPDQSDGAATE